MYIVCILYVYVYIFLQFSLFIHPGLFFSISFSKRFKFQRVLVYLLAKFAFDIAEKEPPKVCPVCTVPCPVTFAPSPRAESNTVKKAEGKTQGKTQSEQQCVKNKVNNRVKHSFE